MSANITGNKGEWSEIYVFFRLLSEGRIYAANDKNEKNHNMYFPVLKIIREEIKSQKYEYVIGDNVQIYSGNTLVKKLSIQKIATEANYLYNQIRAGGSRAFPIVQTQNFMKEIYCNRLAAPSKDKTDITMQIRDTQTGYSPVCGFSIKSEVGSSPTLINATGATNFVFEVTGLSDERVQDINSIETKAKIKDRMKAIFCEASQVKFVKMDSDIFHCNLMMIDSLLSDLIAYSLIYHYRDNIYDCDLVVKKMEEDNPLSFPKEGFYRYKFKKLLCSAALGMTPNTNWDGIDEANGGYIIVTSFGEVLAYHIYNRNIFEEYLLNRTKFERGSTSRHGFAKLYKEQGKTYLKLNFQIRFR